MNGHNSIIAETRENGASPRSQLQLTLPQLLPNDLAIRGRARLFDGLKAFVNTGDGEEEYRALASQWPKFWPHGIDDGGAADALNWSADAHALFLDYRDKLRKVWAGDPEAMFSSVLAYLLGIIGIKEFMGAEYVLDVDAAWLGRELAATSQAWQSLLQLHPEATQALHSMAFPQWGLGSFRYLPRSEFESALWLLCQESWRARVCGQCRQYFIAATAAKKYCSAVCYGEAKRGQKLAWWAKTGKKNRAQRRSRRDLTRRSRARRQNSR